MSFVSSISLGLGFMLGVLIFFIILIVIFRLLKGSKGEFTPEMFEVYKHDIINEERYEEVNEIDIIIKSLKDEKPNNKLLAKYEVKREPELILESKKDDKTSIKIGGNSRVVLKNSFKRRNKK